MKTVLLPGRLAGIGAAVAGLMLCFAGAAVGQSGYDDKTSVPVTFFDFQSDRSNPEFEQPHGKYRNNGNLGRPNMVQAMLDKDSLPVANAANAGGYLNLGVRFWFRDWNNLTASKYKMAAETVDGHSYLEKFRPVYKYGSDGSLDPPGIEVRVQGSSNCNTANPCWTASEWDNNDYRWVKNAYAPGDFTGVISNGNTDIANAYENKVTKGVLRFRHLGSGLYQFKDTVFFPLDNAVAAGRGVRSYNGADSVIFPDGMTPLTDKKWSSTNGSGAAHNYSFTMMMFREFIMKPGLKFDFLGDDDVWLFINNKLVPGVDLGGIHSGAPGSVNLDEIMSTHNLAYDKKYPFHFFYAERHANDSKIIITTNMVLPVPLELKLDVSVDTLTAGKKELVRAVVMNDTGGTLKDFSNGTFTWDARDIGPNIKSPFPRGTELPGQKITIETKNGQNVKNVGTKSDSVYVTAIKAYTWVRIYSRYVDSNVNKAVYDSVDVWVKPNVPFKLWVEDNNDSTLALRDGKQLEAVVISGTATYNDGFYAIMRDQWENWVGTAKTPTTWTVPAAQQTIANAMPGTGTGAKQGQNFGQGRAERATGADKGTADFTVSYTHNGIALTGKGVIRLENVIYPEIQIGIKQGGTFIVKASNLNPTNADSIVMKVNEDTTLWVRLKRPDGSWEYAVAVPWKAANIPGVANPGGPLVSWKITPTGPTTNGSVTADIPTGSGTGSATVKIIVKYNDPVAVRFFYKTGTPVLTGDPISSLVGSNRPNTAKIYVHPTAFVDLVAGEPMPIVGKLFANANISVDTWLDPNAVNSSVKSGKWTWSYAPTSATGNRDATEGISTNDAIGGGDSMTFKSTLATYDGYVKIRGTYTDNTRSPAISLTDSIWIRVIPDVQNAKLHIEPDQNGRAISPNVPRSVSEVVFTSSQGKGTSQSVFAVIRDRYGNYICQSGDRNPYQLGSGNLYPPPDGSGATLWSVVGAASVTAEVGYALWGEGVITRNESTNTTVRACNNAWASGSNACAEVPVKFVNYNIKKVKIVADCRTGSSGLPLATIGGVSYCEVGDTLRMNSNEDKEVFVIGQRDDNDQWETVTGDWGRESGLMEALGTPPSGTGNWKLTPEGTGMGNITVSKNPDLSDNVYVIITVGPPLRAELEITTPADQLIAGKDITGVIRYYNRAGLMREWDPSWNPGKNALFADTLGTIQKNGKDVQPLVRTEVDQVLCYQGNSSCTPNSINAVLPHSSTDLNDFAKFVIYLAADGHQIRYTETLNVGGTPITITAVSAKFKVLPGEPAAIKIEGPGVKDDSLKVNQGDPEQVLHAVAVDEWGNNIGDYPSNWVATTPIPVDAKDRPVIVYVPSMAQDNGRGPLCINAVTASGRPLNSCITVDLTGVTARPVSAITRDYDGCGYLDRIEMKFKRPIPFAGGGTATVVKPSTDKISVVNKDTKLDVDSITVSLKDSTVTIWLHDVAPHSGSTQTGWTPTINIYNGLFEEAGAQTVAPPVVIDGAPPVIATAKLYFPKESGGKISDNYIEVKFSERIKSSDGAPFGISKNQAVTDPKFLPEALFNIWAQGNQNLAKSARTRALSKKSGDPYDGKIFALQDDRLAGIKKTVYIDESTLWFFLENEKEISPPNDYINIRTVDQIRSPINPTRVQDASDNVPLANNRKVPITFGNAPDGNMRAIPNPASPDPTRVNGNGDLVGAGKIYAVHDKTAIQDIRDGRYGGTVFEVPVYVPNTGTVKCQLKVYDLAGNLVISGESENAAAGMETGYTKMHLYWNGYNSKKMKVAPGTYRMVVYISYNNLGKNDENAKNKKFQGIVGMSK